MTEAVAALAVAVAIAALNELRRQLDAWQRRRGNKRSRRGDPPPAGG